MKKYLLQIILIGLFSTPSFAFVSSPDIESPEIQSPTETGIPNNNKEEKKLQVRNYLLKKAIQYKAAKTIIKNPGKTIIAGAAIGGIGYYGYYKMSKELFKEKMARYKLFEQEWQKKNEKSFC